MNSLPHGQQLRACIYCRVSSTKQGELGYSLDGQLAECRHLAGELGATVALERWEVGSGADWDLPGLFEVLEAARRREFDVLLVYDTSRLARDIGKLKVIERTLERAGIAIRYVRHDFDDSPTGEFQRNVMAAVDSYERGNLAVRFKLGKRAKVAQGLVMGQGRVPYGHRRVVDERKGKTIGLEIHPDEAAIVRSIVAELYEHSVDQVAERLTDRGIPTPTGNAVWTGASVYKILNSTSIVGEYVHGKTFDLREHGRRRIVQRPREEWSPVPVPPIVTRQEVEGARAALARRKASHAARRVTQNDSFTLRGMLRCGRCLGQISVAQQHVTKKLPDGSRRSYGMTRYYLCIRSKGRLAELANVPRCDLAWIPAEPLEAHAWSKITSTVLDEHQLRRAVERVARGTVADAARAERIKILGEEIAQRRRALDRITRDRLMADLDEESERSLRIVGASIGKEAEQLEQELKGLRDQEPLGLAAARS
jgi:site-specific DNA recombinase